MELLAKREVRSPTEHSKSMISLIITVLNERETFPLWLESIKEQIKQPDEIVIVDGGSVDGTWEWLQKVTFPNMQAIKEIGNIAHGRNSAIRYAKGDVIAVTDAGCIYHPKWLENMTTPLLTEGIDFVASAFGPWLKAEDALLTYGIASATIPRPGEFHGAPWFASSRSVAFRKKVWEKAGGYPEWIPYSEDIVFDLKVKKMGCRELYLNKTLVFWRPRTTLGGYWRQLYNYTRSDGHGMLLIRRQVIRYGVYGALAIFISLAFKNILWVLPPLMGGLVYCNKYLLRWFSFTRHTTLFFHLSGLVIMPALIFIGDLAKMWGFIMGVYERKKGTIVYEAW